MSHVCFINSCQNTIGYLASKAAEKMDKELRYVGWGLKWVGKYKVGYLW